MQERLEITIEIGKHQADFRRLLKIIDEITYTKISASSREAKQRFFDVLERKLKLAGLIK